MKHLLLLVFLFFLCLSGCSGTRTLTPAKLDRGQAVKVFYKDGSNENIFVVEKKINEIVVVTETEHTTKTIALEEIRSVGALKIHYDDLAYPISAAEINKYKENKNTWGYAIGGTVAGGAIGLVAALPFWFAEVGSIPPYFAAGGGAIIGSIYFALKGQEKDKMFAIEKIRSIRKIERELEDQIVLEKEKLEILKKEKMELQKKVKNSDDRSN